MSEPSSNNSDELNKILLSYSFEDLVKSFFVLNLWLPNVASPIKSQYLYVVLESIFDKLPKENKITEYNHFKNFIEDLLPVLPSFPMMEDYLPENDWGEIRYFLNKKFYNIFYGGDLSNPYDYYYAFEVVHKGFEEYYLGKLKRSPLEELEFCISVQDEIINGIDVKTQDKRDVELAGFTLPSEVFWQEAIRFLVSFDPGRTFNPELLNEYTKDLDMAISEKIPPEEDFLTRAHDGKNCFYFFLKKDNKIFPVLPRKFFAVLFDKWGTILTNHYHSIIKEVGHHETKISSELYNFIRQRAKEEEVFFFGSAIQTDLKPHKTIFAAIFCSKNKLILIHVLPPPSINTNQQRVLESLIPELREAQKLLSAVPTRIGLHGRGQMVQFKSSKQEEVPLEPLIIIVIPHITTSFDVISHPSKLAGGIIGLDQFLGIMDEIEDLDELAEFFEYEKSMQDSFGLSSLVSPLDRFGSFKDSHSVLVPGADDPDLIVLDPHWGTSYRYRSLVKFWTLFPEENFFGHPRSWIINEKALQDNIVMLRSKNFFGYVYCCLLGNTTFYINSPVHELTFEQGKIVDSMMGSLADGMVLYRDLIHELSFAKTGEKLHALFFPLSLVQNNSKFSHLLHLIPSKKPWAMDTTRLGRKDYGIRIVFDDEEIVKVLTDAKDRSIQIELIVDVLKEVNSIFDDSNFMKVAKHLEDEKPEKNRFRVFASRKTVAFPELTSYVRPETRELKLANKKIAELAKGNTISEGEYEGKDAKQKVNLLRNALISYINEEVKQFNLEESIPTLIRNIDALTHEYERATAQVKNSLDQEVDYERDASSGEHKQNFLHHHKINRYLIEKFVQLQPKGDKELLETELGRLLALVDGLLKLYEISDLLYYGIYPAKLIIHRDYLMDVNYAVDINKMQTEWAQEHARISLGMIGNKNDRLTTSFEIALYLDEIDAGFKMDLGFGFKDMINIHHILCLWPAFHADQNEQTSYSATAKEIADVCSKNIDGFDISNVESILDFLTLDPEKILSVEDDPQIAFDLPVWEYRKRPTRYSIRPLIKIGGKYFWGAHSIERSGKTWANIANANKLPADIKAPNVMKILEKGHQVDEKALLHKSKEIASRFTPEVQSNVYPYKLKLSPTEIGDIDVLALLREKNIILNIESKIIDQAYCNKDIKRIAEKIFGRIRSDGSFEGGYIQMVEKRARFLASKGKEVAERYWGTVSSNPTIVSIFVTQSAYWWTKYPPIKTDVRFVEIELLEDFIKNL